MKSLFNDIKFACAKKCPACQKGDLYQKWYSFELYEKCNVCATPLKSQDVGDGAIVILIFILGSTIIPASIMWEFASQPSMWLQGIVWTIVSTALIFGITPIMKAYIMMLQYRHRQSDWV